MSSAKRARRAARLIVAPIIPALNEGFQDAVGMIGSNVDKQADTLKVGTQAQLDAISARVKKAERLAFRAFVLAGAAVAALICLFVVGCGR